MRIIVYPHSLELGGSQSNAVDLAAALQRRGHEVVIFGPPGELVSTIARHGLCFIPAPRARFRPSPAVMRALTRTARRLDTDVIHAFEWPPAVEAAFGPLALDGIPVVATVMSMSVAPFIPRSLPLTVGTRSILDRERPHRPHVSLLVPPVDTDRDRPRDQARSKAQLGIDSQTLVVSLVCRLVPELKLEGVHAAIRAVGRLAKHRAVRLVIAGDGPARSELETAAHEVNSRVGASTVQFTGSLADPSPVYDAADVALGMGGSALRSMAFAKPLIVQGERGFWKLLEPASAAGFEQSGWFGIGSGGDGSFVLAGILEALLTDPQRRARLGDFSRQWVVSHYSLDAAADRSLELYRSATMGDFGRPVSRAALVPPYLSVASYDIGRKVRRRLGGVPNDDFNTLRHMEASARGHR